MRHGPKSSASELAGTCTHFMHPQCCSVTSDLSQRVLSVSAARDVYVYDTRVMLYETMATDQQSQSRSRNPKWRPVWNLCTLSGLQHTHACISVLMIRTHRKVQHFQAGTVHPLSYV